jgi:glycosyltransferase involved in cell wall biosynthesis
MRVALLVTDHERGGTPLRFARLAIGLRQLGVEVHAGCLGTAGPVTALLESQGVPTFAAGASHAADFRTFTRLGKWLREIEPDLIHSALVHANVAGRLVGSWLGIPVLTSTATIEVQVRWHAWIERLTAFLDRGHLVHSSALAGHVTRMFGLSAEHVYVTSPLIRRLAPMRRAAARAALGLPQDGWLVGWLGRFDPVKRVDWVVQAVAALKDENVGVVLGGDGEDAMRIESVIDADHMRARVHCLGWQADPSAFYHALNVLMLPSLTEGVPNVALEALRCGVPVLSSLIPALAGVPGVTMIDATAPKLFSEVLRNFRDDPALCEQLGEAGRAWALIRLSDATALEELHSVYARLLREP